MSRVYNFYFSGFWFGLIVILEIFFAAGCFWGFEKNFASIDGVIDVVSGYSGGSYEDPSYEDVLKNRRIQSESF